MTYKSCDNVNINFTENKIFNYGYELFKDDILNDLKLSKLQGFCDCLKKRYTYQVIKHDNIVFLVRCSNEAHTEFTPTDFLIIFFWEF